MEYFTEEQLQPGILDVVVEQSHPSPTFLDHSVELISIMRPTNFRNNIFFFPILALTSRWAFYFYITAMRSSQLLIKMLRHLWQISVPPGLILIVWKCVRHFFSELTLYANLN